MQLCETLGKKLGELFDWANKHQDKRTALEKRMDQLEKRMDQLEERERKAPYPPPKGREYRGVVIDDFTRPLSPEREAEVREMLWGKWLESQAAAKRGGGSHK